MAALWVKQHTFTYSSASDSQRTATMLPSSGGPMGRDGGYYAETMNHMIDEFTESGDCNDLRIEHGEAEGSSPLGFPSGPLGTAGPDTEASVPGERFSVRQTEMALTVVASSSLDHDSKPPASAWEVARHSHGRPSRDDALSCASSDSPGQLSALGGEAVGGPGAPLRAVFPTDAAEGGIGEVAVHCGGGGGAGQGAAAHRRSHSSACGAFLQRPSRYISAGANAGSMGESGGSLDHDERERGPFSQRARLRTHVVVRIHRGVHRIMELQVRHTDSEL